MNAEAFVAIDFETTGSVQGWPVDPWQIGLASWDGEGWELWESWLRVGERPFHPQAPGRYEQIRDQLAEAPTLEQLLPVLRERLQGRVLVAHNRSTEQGVFRRAVPLENWGPWIDTLSLYRRAWPGQKSYRLMELLRGQGLEEELQTLCPGREAHDALYDALASGLLLRKLLAQPGWEAVALERLFM